MKDKKTDNTLLFVLFVAALASGRSAGEALETADDALAKLATRGITPEGLGM